MFGLPKVSFGTGQRSHDATARTFSVVVTGPTTQDTTSIKNILGIGIPHSKVVNVIFAGLCLCILNRRLNFRMGNIRSIEVHEEFVELTVGRFKKESFVIILDFLCNHPDCLLGPR